MGLIETIAMIAVVGLQHLAMELGYFRVRACAASPAVIVKLVAGPTRTNHP